MLKDASTELYSSKHEGLKRLGIDEIALIKGQGNYCTVLIDLDTSKLMTMIYGRTQEVLKKTLIKWGSEVLDQIEEVSIDLWQGYRSLVKELIPLAQLVADRFHVMVQINKELDPQRKREKDQVEEAIKKAKSLQDQAEYEKIFQGLTKSKYVLLKNEKELNEIQKDQLIQVKQVSHNLNTMHELKEEIRQIFEKTNNWDDGLFRLGTWLLKAKKHFPNSYNTILRWLDEIVAYFDNRTTSGVVEGINNKLKLIKRSAYGFKNFDNFRVRCLLTWQFHG